MLVALLLAGCGQDHPLDTGALCTVPITILPGDYTIDQNGEWLYLADTGDEVRIVEPCNEAAT